MRLISFKEVAYKTSISVRQIGRLIERGQFPKPVPPYPGGRRMAFVEGEVDEHIEEQVRAARAGAAPEAEPPAAAENRAEPNGHAKRADPPAGRRRRQTQPPPRRPQRGAAPKTPI
jgi:predicted DNA-binding transcriptional regulator AlpA